MGATLGALHALQEIERKLAAIRAKTDQMRRKLRVQQRTLQKQDLLIEEKRKAVQECQMEIDRIDLDVKSRDNDLNRHREALNKAKTNKEYAAILTAINTEKADNTKLESRQLELMDTIDQRRAETAECITEQERVSARVAQAEEALEACIAASTGEIKTLERQRDETAEGIAPTILDTFRRVAERHDGDVMAPVAVLNAKRDEYGCGGCNMAIRLQQALGCKSRDEIIQCDVCGRILYWE